jgi:hypothetical protein
MTHPGARRDRRLDCLVGAKRGSQSRRLKLPVAVAMSSMRTRRRPPFAGADRSPTIGRREGWTAVPCTPGLLQRIASMPLGYRDEERRRLFLCVTLGSTSAVVSELGRALTRGRREPEIELRRFCLRAAARYERSRCVAGVALRAATIRGPLVLTPGLEKIPLRQLSWWRVHFAFRAAPARTFGWGRGRADYARRTNRPAPNLLLR